MTEPGFHALYGEFFQARWHLYQARQSRQRLAASGHVGSVDCSQVRRAHHHAIAAYTEASGALAQYWHDTSTRLTPLPLRTDQDIVPGIALPQLEELVEVWVEAGILDPPDDWLLVDARATVCAVLNGQPAPVRI